MKPIDLRGPTAEGFHWSCTACKFDTTLVEVAIHHCEERSADFPAHEHLLRELPASDGTRRAARRVIFCRDRFGLCQRARITRSRWCIVDGRAEIRGVTIP